MENENKDVDLYEELKKELEKSDDEEPSGASAQEPQEPDENKKESGDENAELSEEEISKLSPRAQKRIREQAAEIKRLAEEAAAKAPEEISKEENKSAPENFKTIQDFLAAVEDEPSRKLLETFYGVMKSEISNTLSPIEKQNREALFDSEFSKFEKIEGVSDYKDDLKKTFMKNPGKTVQDLVGGVVTEIQLSKVGKIETDKSNPNREGKVDTDGLSKEQLYDLLESEKS